MAEYDVVVRGGTIVDGTGIPRYKSDIGVKDGKVARISGKIPAGGAREIDASGCIVAPGAVDLHTHYDAQVNWDPYCSLSGWFGVTSLTIGECGFGFAPTKPEDRDLNMRMMNRIEAIPLESMRKGMRWDWVTFPEYMDSLERQGLGINIGAMFPFSPMRGYVLGMMESRERTSVTDTEQDQMKELFREAMQAGAFGFSFNKNMEDRPEDGSFLPSHVASDEEFHALAEVLSDFGVGHIGLTHGFGLSPEQRSAVRKPGDGPDQDRRSPLPRPRRRNGFGPAVDTDEPRGGPAAALPASMHRGAHGVQAIRVQPVRLHAQLDPTSGGHRCGARRQAQRLRGPRRDETGH